MNGYMGIYIYIYICKHTYMSLMASKFAKVKCLNLET